MKATITIPASEIRAGDDIKTSDGFLNVGGVQTLGGSSRLGLFTPKGMIGVDADDQVTVRRVAEQGTE